MADALVPRVDGVNSLYFTKANVLPTPQVALFSFKYPQWVPQQPAMVTRHGSGPETGWLTKKKGHRTVANIPHINAFGDLMYWVSMHSV